MADKLKKVIITKKCRVDGVHKEPGDEVEGNASDMNYLVAIDRATFDLKWTPPANANAEKKGKGKN